MLYLSFIWHMHQPYYRDIASGDIELPWVRLHGIKDYLDMVKILGYYPNIRQTFNLVPSLIEQIDAYVQGSQDKYQKISYKKAVDLSVEEKKFILERFFSINLGNVISIYPRYYQLYLKKEAGKEFFTQDYLDLQVWFNLAWFDHYFKVNLPELSSLINKARNFSEEDKITALNKQIDILKEIIPAYKEFQDRNQIEVIVSPYYHPITPLLCDTDIAKESNPETPLISPAFRYPDDAISHINQAVKIYQDKFGRPPEGMWPSEEAVSEEIIPLIADAGIKWIVTDEAILFKSLRKKRNAQSLYRPYLLKRGRRNLSVLFRDRNLSDLIGFVYYNWDTWKAAEDFIAHLHTIAKADNKDKYVVIAMDGENAWEYYRNDGWDFLAKLYKALNDDPLIKSVTVSEYLKKNPPRDNIRKLASGSWIYGNFNKWIGQKEKNTAWEYLLKAREELKEFSLADGRDNIASDIGRAWKQMLICEGSDWFWWYGDNNSDFDDLYRKHLVNFYRFLNKEPPGYLHKPI